MKPWHLIPANLRAAVIERLDLAGCGCSDCFAIDDAYRAAIALLEAAAPYGDEDLVYEYKSETLWLWDIGGDPWNPWAIYLVGEHRDAIQVLPSSPLLMPLTPAADSLLRALRGDE